MKSIRVILPILLTVCTVSCKWLGRQAEKGIEATENAVEDFIAGINGDIESLDAALVPADDLPDDARGEEIENIAAVMAQYPELDGYKPYVSEYGDGVFHITGNFFGDRDDDLAVLIIHEDDSVPKRYEDCVKICIINKGEYGLRYVVFDDEESFRAGCGYDWVGVFMSIPPGEPLWSNYEDDFRSFDEVPWDEVVRLPYDAIYAHVEGACGGGFIFWKNDRWNWLQQE